MVSLRPHFIEYTPVPSATAQMAAVSVQSGGFPFALPMRLGPPPVVVPEDDEWLPVNEAVKVLHPCRLQPSGNGDNLIQTQDGVQVAYSDLIYLDRKAEPVPFGAKVTVYGDKEKTEVIGVRTVKRFHKGQLHAKIWV